MYFWRIEQLKTEMAARPLSEREALPYLVVFVALSSAVAYIPQTTQNLWDGVGTVWSVLLAVVGTIYIYRQNGGAGGQHFLQRYLPSDGSLPSVGSWFSSSLQSSSTPRWRQ